MSLLISSIAFTGQRLDEAKLGALATVVVAPAVGWVVFAVIRRLPQAVRARQIGGTAEDILDLTEDPDPERDHIRGPDDAPVTLLEYGDFQCPYCGQAEGVIRELLSEHGDDVRYVWRHLPLNDVHPRAQLAAEASEAAAAQGTFWEMYDVLLAHQDELAPQRPPALRAGARARRRAVRTGAARARVRAARGRGRGVAPTRAASRGLRRSSSTAAATTASTTSTR